MTEPIKFAKKYWGMFECCCRYTSFNDDNVGFIDEFVTNCSSRLKYRRSYVNITPRTRITSLRTKNLLLHIYLK